MNESLTVWERESTDSLLTAWQLLCTTKTLPSYCVAKEKKRRSRSGKCRAFTTIKWTWRNNHHSRSILPWNLWRADTRFDARRMQFGSSLLPSFVESEQNSKILREQLGVEVSSDFLRLIVSFGLTNAETAANNTETWRLQSFCTRILLLRSRWSRSNTFKQNVFFPPLFLSLALNDLTAFPCSTSPPLSSFLSASLSLYSNYLLPHMQLTDSS